MSLAFHRSRAERIPASNWPGFAGPPRDNGVPVVAEFAQLRATGGAPAWLAFAEHELRTYVGVDRVDIVAWVRCTAPWTEVQRVCGAAYSGFDGHAYRFQAGREDWYVFTRTRGRS